MGCKANMRQGVKRCLALALMSAGCAAAPASAASTTFDITGAVPARCSLSIEKRDVQLGTANAGASGSAGQVGFACNLVETGPTVQLTSANHGLRRDGGAEVLAYLLSWDLAGQAGFINQPAARGAITATLPADDPGKLRSGELRFIIPPAASDGLPAGSYADVITITVSP